MYSVTFLARACVVQSKNLNFDCNMIILAKWYRSLIDFDWNLFRSILLLQIINRLEYNCNFFLPSKVNAIMQEYSITPYDVTFINCWETINFLLIYLCTWTSSMSTPLQHAPLISFKFDLKALIWLSQSGTLQILSGIPQMSYSKPIELYFMHKLPTYLKY